MSTIRDTLDTPDVAERTEVDRSDPLVGTVLDGRFRLDARIAAGGFGAIYRATHQLSGRLVAIKVLHPAFATDPELVARFRREGAVLSELHSPHTVTTYEVGADPDGTLYIVMELLGGESLFERLRGGELPWRAVVAIACQVCDSLAEAHALGIIHRDLKPANIQLEPRADTPDFVKVLDFGIAKAVRGARIDDGAELTATGQVIGTFDYMSPEQISGRACDVRSDLYTLGVVIFEMLTGGRPFAEATTAPALLTAMVTATPAPASSRAPVPPELDRVVSTCLAREPRDRYAGALELRRALESCLGRASARPADLDGEEAVTQVAPPRPRAIAAPTEVVARPRPLRAGGSTPAPVDRRSDPRLRGAAPTFDMDRLASRDALIRRIVWTVVIVIGAVLGYMIAR